jgi:sterol 3beta-glucosyltransferase
VSPRFVGFWSKTFAQSATRYRLSISIIKEANAVLTKVLRFNRLALVLDGQADLQFDFKTAELRDRAIGLINTALETEAPQSSESSISSPLGSFGGSLTPTSTSSRDTKRSYVPHVPSRSATGIFSPLSRTMAASALTEHLPDIVVSMLPKAINLPRDILQSKEAMHFMCLTIGSRGDVQPYIALALGLKKEGHRVTIVTHEEYKEWVVGFGIEHRIAGGDPGALMKLSVENKVTY